MHFFNKDKNLSQDPQIRKLEKSIAKDGRADQKNLDQATREVRKAEKTHEKAVKVCNVPISHNQYGD